MKKAVKIPLIVVSILFVIFISMAALKICPPQGPWPMPPWCEVAPATTPTETSTAPLEPTLEPGETHEGDLVISDEKYVIEDKTIYLKGSLIVKNSTLIIRNSKIIIMQEFFGQYWIEITENSEFIVENSVLERQGRHNTLLMVRDGSKAVIKDTKSGWDIVSGGGEFLLENYDARNAANGIFFQGNNITAINSKFNIISIQNIAGSQKSTINFDGLKKGFIKNLTIERENKILRLQDTSVERWVIDVGEPVNPNFIDVSIKNSEIWGLWIWFYPGSYVEISDLKPGLYKEWKMSQKFRLENISYDIELENTNIEMFKLQIVGKAKVENCSGIQVATRANASVYVKDSIIEVNLILRGNEEVVLENSAVKGGLVQFIEDRSDLQSAFGRGGNPHVLELRGARINAPLEIGANYTKIKGEGVFSKQDVNWVFGVVEREYPVEMRDESGANAGDVWLNLFDPQNNLVWSGITDQNGSASFAISFTENNWNKKWRLETVINGKRVSREVEFLTGTPIVLRP